MVTVGVDLERSRTALDLAHHFAEVWAGVGHHPTEKSAPDVDALRVLMVQGATAHYGLATDFLVLVLTNLAITLFAARLYPRVVQ